MKRLLVGTALGRLAMSVRGKLELIRASLSQPELAGMLANDALAARLVTRLCQPDKVFVDVGAHIGSVLGEVRRLRPNARVVAVEAIPEKAAALRRRFPGVELHACALGETEGDTTFFVDNRRSGYSSLERPSEASKPDTTPITVPLRRLDSLLAPSGVDVIKIDVEGAELGVLRGGERVITACRPTIMFESGPADAVGLGYTKEALWDWLAAHRYAVLVPNRVAHNDPGLGREGFLESHLFPRRTSNYFAVASERREEIRDRARKLV